MTAAARARAQPTGATAPERLLAARVERISKRVRAGSWRWRRTRLPAKAELRAGSATGRTSGRPGKSRDWRTAGKLGPSDDVGVFPHMSGSEAKPRCPAPGPKRGSSGLADRLLAGASALACSGPSASTIRRRRVANTSVGWWRHSVLVHAEVERGQVRRRVLHGMRDCDRAVALGVGEVRGAMGSHAPREPQRLRHNMRLLGGSGVGRQQGLAGAFSCCDLRAPDSELVGSELGLIEPSAALRFGPEWHAVGPDALGECPRLIVCRAAARRAAVRAAARRRQQGEAPNRDEGCQGSRCGRPRPPLPRSDGGAGVHDPSLTAGRCCPCAQDAWPAEHARPSAGAHSARGQWRLHVVGREGSRCR